MYVIENCCMTFERNVVNNVLTALSIYNFKYAVSKLRNVVPIFATLMHLEGVGCRYQYNATLHISSQK